jgi:hypothetical protein
LINFQGMQDATAESIKSLEGFRIAWVEKISAGSSQHGFLISPILFAFVPGGITRRWADQILWVARTLVTRRTGYWSRAGIGRVAPAKAALLFKEQPIYERSALWRAAPIAKKLCCSVK